MALEFGDHGADLGQLGELVPDRFGVGRRGLLGQRGVAGLAMAGDQGNDVLHARGRQTAALVPRVSGLAAALASRGFLDDGRRGSGWVGRGSQRGVGGVEPQALLQVTDLTFQALDTLLQRRDEGVTLDASRATRLAHTFILPGPGQNRSPESAKALGGYF